MSADNNVWLTRIKGFIKAIREAIKPELAIPSGEDDPINYRITRLRTLLKKARDQHQEWHKTMEHIDTNLEGLLEELNPTRTPNETMVEPEPKAPKKTKKEEGSE